MSDTPDKVFKYRWGSNSHSVIFVKVAFKGMYSTHYDSCSIVVSLTWSSKKKRKKGNNARITQ